MKGHGRRVRDVVNRDEILELVEEMDGVLRGKIVDLTQYQEVRTRLVAAAERHTVRLKVIADMANLGRPARATIRQAVQLARQDDGPQAA